MLMSKRGNNNNNEYSTCCHSETAIGHAPTTMGGAIVKLHTIIIIPYSQPHQWLFTLITFTLPYNNGLPSNLPLVPARFSAECWDWSLLGHESYNLVFRASHTSTIIYLLTKLNKAEKFSSQSSLPNIKLVFSTLSKDINCENFNPNSVWNKSSVSDFHYFCIICKK